MQEKEYDVVIVGAGPAGCACAYQLRNSHLKIALIDKETFPRDKICGDGLSADVVNQFYRMDVKLAEKFEAFNKMLPSHGARLIAPNESHIDAKYTNPNFGKAAGYICKRIDFDNFWFEQIKDLENIHVFQNCKVNSVATSKIEIRVHTNSFIFNAKMAIGADGAHSVLSKQLTSNKINKKHYAAGLRQYYTGVTGFHPGNHIELHFYKELLPGYFWVFPLPDNQANVGITILSSEVSKRKINLKNKLDEIIQNHPNLKDRFKNAKPINNKQGFGLPLGSKKRKVSGNRLLLLGDAASLIDPFSGEGIGNAIRSGRIAAEHIEKAFDYERFDAKFNLAYDKKIYNQMWVELRLSHSLQKLCNYPKLLNFLVNKANNNPSFLTLITSMVDNIDIKKELLKPSFYFKLFFNRA